MSCGLKNTPDSHLIVVALRAWLGAVFPVPIRHQVDVVLGELGLVRDDAAYLSWKVMKHKLMLCMSSREIKRTPTFITLQIGIKPFTKARRLEPAAIPVTNKSEHLRAKPRMYGIFIQIVGLSRIPGI